MFLRAQIPPSARSELNKSAALERHHPEAVEDIADARRRAKFLTLEDYIQRTVDAAPSLDTEQRERLVAILRPSVAAGGVA